jgi:lipopolysaccharide transport system ATP-binding protein
MAAPAIRVEGLGKRYRLAQGADRAAYRTLRESLTNFVTAPLRRRGTVEEFWALSDVSFEVQPGEVVGIIGRNGAGKSTLLKILSRITKPTTGRVEINGRVGSLLEVGTGFHPELTGRENIYLNGSILGMSRAEVARKFDEIVAFAEVEKFLDTPVKRYSSGMYVRLAFAVAAHLEPEILIVDEVLAVGDAGFQKRCLRKIEGIAQSGRTILLVSHQMGAVQTFCSQAIFLERGRVRLIGDKTRVIAEYLNTGESKTPAGATIPLNTGNTTRGRARFVSVRYGSGDGAAQNQLYPDGPADFTIRIEAACAIDSVYLALNLADRYDTRLVNCDSHRLPEPVRLGAGTNDLVLSIKSLHLNPGTYSLGLWMADSGEVLDTVALAGEVEVMEYSPDPEVLSTYHSGAVSNRFSIRPALEPAAGAKS